MGSVVTGLVSSKRLDGDSTRLWHRGLRQVGLTSDLALKDASTCHLESRDSYVLDKKKVKFDIVTHHLHDFLDCVHMDI